MVPKKYRKELDSLIDRYSAGTATTEESRFMEEYYNSFENKDGISAQLTEEEKEAWKQLLLARIHKGIAQTEQAPVIPLYRRTWFRIAAACIIAVVGVATYVILSGVEGRHKEQPPVATTHDVPAPKETRAVITLANGSKVYLDSVENGTIAEENNVNIIRNSEGGIQYQGKANSQQLTANSPVYNTLFNPRGSKVISLTLSDGTKVWLNSESSLKYPTAFNDHSREVEITGEAYFEVKHNAQQPFKVHLPNGSIVEDIGTSFNVNAYNDEESIKTTLIEGSVRVVGDATLNTNNGMILKPGQQAVIHQVNPGIKRIEVQTADATEVLAWKNGLFSFEKADIKSIMKEVSRWYDVDVVYTSDIQELFRLKTSRNTSVSNIFKILEATGVVHLKVDGRKIIVSP
jgi:ferric-dicitrate binding protein FerR (iron transport regulator)